MGMLFSGGFEVGVLSASMSNPSWYVIAEGQTPQEVLVEGFRFHSHSPSETNLKAAARQLFYEMSGKALRI